MTSLPHEKQRKEVKEMNTLVIVLIAAVCLFGAYTLYGRWLANKWGIDPKAKTPAVQKNDGKDYVPTMRTAGITFPPTAGPFLHISSAPLQVPALLPVPFRLLPLAGYLFCCGSCWAASSLVLLPTSALCMLL